MINPRRPARWLPCLLAIALAALALPASAVEYRTIDGSGNNVANAVWGSQGANQVRNAPADYRGDAAPMSAIDDRGRPAPRTISNALFAQTGNMYNARGMTAGVWQWGQFLDHDIVLTTSNPAEMSMLMSPGDPFGVEMIPFARSNATTDTAGDRQQINAITSYIDASNVYGSDQTRADALRSFSGGLMRTSAGNLLPTNDMPGLGSLPNANDTHAESQLFVAGDVRANEQVGLTAMHTVFVREHNRLATALAANNPSWDDEQLYQTARRIVGAEMQAITYNEFLPALMGPHAPSPQSVGAYSPTVDAGIANEFAAAFFRLGHSMLNDEVLLADDGGQVIASLSLADAFFRPSLILSDPNVVDKSLMGLTSMQSQELDTKLVDGVRNFLFAPTGQMGLDLAALNIQRGRDHGLPDYNSLRDAYGLDKVDSFDDITADIQVASILESLYTTVDNIDAWVGALAEDHLPGASIGELITASLFDQFSRLAAGDRFFYTSDPLLASAEVTAVVDLAGLTMMDIVDWNTTMDIMPASFFMGTPIPEPASLTLVSILGFAATARRWRR